MPATKSQFSSEIINRTALRKRVDGLREALVKLVSEGQPRDLTDLSLEAKTLRDWLWSSLEGVIGADPPLEVAVGAAINDLNDIIDNCARVGMTKLSVNAMLQKANHGVCQDPEADSSGKGPDKGCGYP